MATWKFQFLNLARSINSNIENNRNVSEMFEM